MTVYRFIKQKMEFMSLKSSKRGGYRENAGRKKGEPTTTLRVPVALVDKIKEMVRKHKDKSFTC